MPGKKLKDTFVATTRLESVIVVIVVGNYNLVTPCGPV